MKVITPSDCFSYEYWTSLAPRVFHYEPGKPYLVSNRQFDNLSARQLTSMLDKVSHAEPAFHDFNLGSAKPGSSVLFYNGCGGMGDSIMAWPVTKILADAGFEVHLLSEPHLEFAWQGFPWISTIQLLPMYWKTRSFFDYHAIFESISNSYLHGEQEHPTDHALRKLGFDPGEIPPEKKVVRPIFTPLERKFASWLYPGMRLAFFQLRASQDARSLPVASTRAVFARLAMEFPQFHWIGIAAEMDDYSREADPKLPNTEVRRFHRLRNLWALMERAEIVVAPDSMAVHLAGSLGIPCVGMWGLYEPSVRVRYHAGHVPVYRKEACDHSPCNWNFPGYPKFCPPSEQPRKYCAVMEAVTPDDVVDAARRALEKGSVETAGPVDSSLSQ
jgi:ADP-heptose:LPS heptosyltransferase